MKKYLIALVASMTLLNSGCGKKGCTDPDADNHDNDAKRDDGQCLYRFASAINVNVFPVLDGNNNDWDIGGAPDVYVRFKRSASTTWDYETNTATDSYAPFSLILLTANIKFTNEDWQFQLMDYDWPSSDDLIASGTFNPLKMGSNNNIIVQALNGSNLTFQYTLK